jgi:isoamylase
MGRTQQGNNNAYCQDNEVVWFDWSAVDQDLLDFTRRLIALRRAHPVFRRRRFLSGAAASALAWYTPAGTRMTSSDWADRNARCLTIHLDGTSDPDRAEDGTPEVDHDFLVLVNGWWEPLTFTIPDHDGSRPWLRELDSYDPAAADGAPPLASGDGLTVGAGSVVVLRSPR